MEFLQESIRFFTRTDSIGFPLLIAAGLGLIIALIRAQTNVQRRESIGLQERASEIRKGTTPYKPF